MSWLFMELRLPNERGAYINRRNAHRSFMSQCVRGFVYKQYRIQLVVQRSARRLPRLLVPFVQLDKQIRNYYI